MYLMPKIDVLIMEKQVYTSELLSASTKLFVFSIFSRV